MKLTNASLFLLLVLLLLLSISLFAGCSQLQTAEGTNVPSGTQAISNVIETEFQQQ